MDQPIMIGCDLHDRSMLLKVAAGRGAAETWNVPNTAEGRRKMIARLQEQSRRQDSAPLVFAYEASGQGFGLHDELEAAGIRCHVLAPTKIERSPQAKRRKTDEKDALQILELLRAHLLAGNRLPDVWIPDAQTRDDRELVRARLDAADKVAALKTQVKSLLKRNCLTRPSATGKGWNRAYRRWLDELSGDSAGRSGMRAGLASLLRQLDFQQREVERLELELSRLATSPRYAAAVQRLVKMSGVGILTALVFLTELGRLSRFANRRQVAAYLGLVPSSQESGQRNDRKGHITRQGPSRVRQVLCQAAWTRNRGENVDSRAYQRIAAKNPKHKKIAVVASMRRLAVRMWHQGRLAETQPAAWPSLPALCATAPT
jgi:transposase